MTTAYNIHDAKTHFSKLVAAVERGEKVTICRNGEPVMACVPIEKSSIKFPFGAWENLSHADLDALAAPTDEETLDAMGL